VLRIIQLGFNELLPTAFTNTNTNTNTNTTVRFVQTGPGAHPSSYTMGAESFTGVKRPGCGIDPLRGVF
jgi:hypothetical protein